MLLLAATPALSQIRSDQALAPVVLGAGPTRQESARVASDGTNFFVVWRARTASNTVVLGGGRVSPAGELLDQPSILFASGNASAFGDPDVVFVGGNFLVVYQAGTSVVTRRFGRDGRPVDAEPVVIDNTAMTAWLATNGQNVFLPTAANRFRLLAPDGTPIGAEHGIPDLGFNWYAAGSNGNRYLIAYPNEGLLFLLTGTGDFLVKKGISLEDDRGARFLTVASNGSSFLLMSDNAVMTVDADGNPGVQRSLPYQSHGPITATWSGSEYTLVFQTALFPGFDDVPPTGYAIDGLRVDAAGVPLDSVSITVLPGDRPTAAFASASNGRDTIIITGDSDLNSENWHTTAAIFKSLPQIDAEPANRRHVAIASSAKEQAGGSIASNGTLSLVTWRESSGVDQAIVRGAFISADGQLGSPVDLGEASWQTATATASNGRDFFVVYADPGNRLVGRRVTLEGMVDSTPIVITGSPFGQGFASLTDGLAAGWSGRTYVVVTARSMAIWRITPEGTLLDSQLAEFGLGGDTAAVSCASSGCSITWHCPQFDLFADTDSAGTVIGLEFLTFDAKVTPALSLPASDDQSVFVYSRGQSMFAGRITAAGVVIDTPKVNGGVVIMKSETAFPLQPVAVVHDGLYFVELDTDTTGRLYWTRIEPEPTPHVTSLVNLHQSVTLPLTLTASARNTYFLYSAGEDDAKVMAPRLFLRTLASPGSQPAPVRRHAAH